MPEHVQRFPDGLALPVPVHPRFHFAVLDGEWGWIAADGQDLALTMLRNGGAGWPWLYEWQSCCAVAVCAFRVLQRRTMHAVVAPGRFSDYVCQPKRDAEMWEAELAKADAELRRA